MSASTSLTQSTSRKLQYRKMLLIAPLCPAVVVVLWFWWNTNAYNRSDGEVQAVNVYPGATDTSIGNLLYGRGLMRSSMAYRIYLRLSGYEGKMQAGTYEISPNMSVAQIARKFSSGEVLTSVLTILPGQWLSDTRRRFIAAGFSESEVSAALQVSNYQGHVALQGKPADANLEGYLHAESFQYTGTTELTSIVRSSLDLTARLFAQDIKQQIALRGLSLHQAVILASIIEREVHDPNVKPMVAQVFLKRLRIGKELGSDATAYYGASLLGAEETVAVRSPYNTRLYRGWPPGPISNISESSLRAVAMPAATDYLYFVTGDDGNTYFSKSLAEHKMMIETHCKTLCQLD